MIRRGTKTQQISGRVGETDAAVLAGVAFLWCAAKRLSVFVVVGTTLLVVGVMSMPNANGATTLHGLWRFGEEDGSSAIDGAMAADPTLELINDIHLDRTGSPTYTTNTAPGSAFAINLGLNDQYQSTSVATTVTNNVVIEAWFYYVGGVTFPIASNGNSGVNGYAVGVFDGKWAGLYGGVGWLPSDVSVIANTWTHLALVRDGGEARFFVNGAEANIVLDLNPGSATVSSLEALPAAPSGETLVGQAGTMLGLVDTVRIYTFDNSGSGSGGGGGGGGSGGGGGGGGFNEDDLFFDDDVPEPATGMMILFGAMTMTAGLRGRRCRAQ